MKKTILAAAIALATAPTFASVTAYDNVENGVKIDVSGAAEVQYYKGFKDADFVKVDKTIPSHTNSKGETVKESKAYDVDWKDDAQLRLDDGDIQVDAEFKVSDNLTALSTVAFEFEDGKTTNDELTVGLKSGNSTLKFGRQTMHSDDYGISEDIELGYGSGFDITDGDQVIKYTYNNDALEVGASYLMNRKSTKYIKNYNVNDDKLETSFNNYTKGNDGDSLDLYTSYKVSGLTTKIFYNVANNADLDILKDEASYHNGMAYDNYNQKTKNLVVIPVYLVPSSYDVKAYGIEATYEFDDITLAAGYTTFNYDDVAPQSKVDFDKDVINLAATYTIDNNKFAIGYAIAKIDGSDNQTVKAEDPQGSSFDTDTKNLYANVIHKFNDNVSMYAEVGYKTYDVSYTDLSTANNEDKEVSKYATSSFDDSEVAYVVGMEVKF